MFKGQVTEISDDRNTGVVKFEDDMMNHRVNPAGILFPKPFDMSHADVGKPCYFWLTFRYSGCRAENLVLAEDVQIENKKWSLKKDCNTYDRSSFTR